MNSCTIFFSFLFYLELWHKLIQNFDHSGNILQISHSCQTINQRLYKFQELNSQTVNHSMKKIKCLPVETKKKKCKETCQAADSQMSRVPKHSLQFTFVRTSSLLGKQKKTWKTCGIIALKNGAQTSMLGYTKPADFFFCVNSREKLELPKLERKGILSIYLVCCNFFFKNLSRNFRPRIKCEWPNFCKKLYRVYLVYTTAW